MGSQKQNLQKSTIGFLIGGIIMNIDDTIKSNFQFIGSCILRIDLKNDLLFLPEADELKLVMGAEYEINQIEYTDDRILGTVTLEVKARAKKKKSSQQMSVKIYIQGCFTDSADISETSFREMLGLNGCATLYSIARAQIINLTSQAMNGGQLILPMINFFEMKKIKDKKESEKKE